jgi:CRP-like cAMP-binding protein
MSLQAARIEMLQRMPFFGGIRSDAIEILLDPVRTLRVAAGRYFFRENDPGDSMFVLESGHASVLKRWQARSYELHSLGPGDCFGEMSLMDLGPRSASVRAVEDCSAIEVSADALLRLFERDAVQFALVQMNMGREVCRRLRTTDDLLFRVGNGEPLEEGQTGFHAL